ncbi:MAG: LysM peptidoglycan-binding domain-containing protein [Chloroflexi bacterium]|nr:LysM peptidoglycan-binding domain-containing protein [Chloroflexota bacterium]
MLRSPGNPKTPVTRFILPVAIASAVLFVALLLLNAAKPGLTTPETPAAPSPARTNTVTATTQVTTTPAPTDAVPLPTMTLQSTAATVSAPAARPISYTVVENDTLWGIAVKFGLSLDSLVAANPGINPDVLFPGDVLNIPAPGQVVQPQVAAATATLAALPAEVSVVEMTPVNGVVATTGDRLRLRRQPSASADIVTRLPPATPLVINARTSDGNWLRVQLPDGVTGWVMAQYVNTDGSAPVVVVQTTPTAVPNLSVKPSGTVQPISTDVLPRSEPYLKGFTTRAIEIYQAGLAMGNHPDVFTLVGDSNTANPAFIEPIDKGNYDLGEYGYLEETIRFFKGSFNLSSVAAVGGFNTTRLYEPERASPALCQPGEGSLVCEYRIKKPSVALILIGTNDRPIWQDFERNYRPIIEDTISRGIVPVLMTKGDDMETQYGGPSGYINTVIVKLSEEYSIPLLDLKQAIGIFNLPHGGFEGDGFHYNQPSDGRSAVFGGNYLQYGYTIRNLTALQALDAVRRLIIDTAR